MNTVTHQMMCDFINSRPDDEPVKFNENHYNNPCGCIMIKYGRAHGFDQRNSVGMRSFCDETDDTPAHVLERRYDEYIPKDGDGDYIYDTTIGDIKKHLGLS